MGLRIAEIDQHAVAHVFRHKAAEAANRLGDAFLIGRNDLAKSSGSMRAESAVEPTRSENITVTWRRSAESGGSAQRWTQATAIPEFPLLESFSSAIARKQLAPMAKREHQAL